jgi:hydrogenase nickel incorporation protein HypA/HybF
MHELSIALSIIDIVSEQCLKRGFEKIDSINVRIGRASGIMPDALVFAFEAIKEGSRAGDAVLHIEEVPVTGHCAVCDRDFTSEEEFVFACPVCKGGSFKIISGREMDIIDMEVS